MKSIALTLGGVVCFSFFVQAKNKIEKLELGKQWSDTGIISTDYAATAKKYMDMKREDSAMIFFEKAFAIEKTDAQKSEYAQKLAAYYKEKKNYLPESKWLGEIYKYKKDANNVDLFNWGVACFNGHDFVNADTAFSMYERKYPTQTYGYYWAAKSCAAIDNTMESGVAIPHYEKLIEIASKDTANKTTRTWLATAYSYIAAFKANKFKDYKAALDLYDKVLLLEPANADAIKYKQILEKMIEEKK